jgi:hypothetical protein
MFASKYGPTLTVEVCKVFHLGRLLHLPQRLVHLSWTKTVQESVTRLIALAVKNLITPNAATKIALLFNNAALAEAGLLNI